MNANTPSPFANDADTDGIGEYAEQKNAHEGVNAKAFVPTIKKRKEELTIEQIPVTVFTGYLGAGKTTVITNLIRQMPEGYNVAWLKNEMGNTVVDTALAGDQRTATVKEMLQGCICHVMIGQLDDVLDELVATEPQRIIIEASGSATPAPVVWQIREHNRLFVDGVVTVIDAENFSGYVDKSPALKMQAQYTDLILINKHENLTETDLEQNLDDLYEINLDTPKVQTQAGYISADVVFGLDSQLFLTAADVAHEEKDADKNHYHQEVELLELRPHGLYPMEKMTAFAGSLSGTDFYRIKGVLRDEKSDYILNCAFGKSTTTRLNSSSEELRIVFMGENLQDYKEKIIEFFGLSEGQVIFTPKD